MKRQRNVNLLLMLVLLVAVGQMAQTIYIPAIADMAQALNVREGAVQSVMAAYLLTYGVSQLFYGPLSDRVGRPPRNPRRHVYFYGSDPVRHDHA
ncbi:multidrug resistance protein D [Salmonella enterica subsp. enterica]|uniref:Multidrug resistance protein D n=1 Tax=Salmonella enterica I TaxID=59201 RepID=A0A447N1L8_SALET|nr:multidrug resistance protein D [Salmonella enterica subsp. enterica]